MGWRNRLIASVTFVAALGVLGTMVAAQKIPASTSTKTAPSSKPSASPKRPAGKSPELEKAIAALKREFAASAKATESTQRRTASDYFAGESNIPLENVLGSLEKPVPGVPASDARQTAYVKWQLLSALPPTLEPPAVKRLMKIYERAPLPAPRYGISKPDQKKLDSLMSGARPQDDVKFNAMIEESAARTLAADAPIIAYRDELYSRLPMGRDRFVAAMVDANARLAVGADTEKLATTLESELPVWAESSDAKKAEVREVADLLGKLRFIESPPYYAYASVRTGKLGWRTRIDTLYTKARAEKLQKRLHDAASGKAAAGPDKKD